MGARMVPANGQTTKIKKNLLYVVLVGKTFHLITNIYIRVQFLQIYTFACNFCSRKGGRASIGYRASIGTYTVCLITKYNNNVVRNWTSISGSSIVHQPSITGVQ